MSRKIGDEVAICGYWKSTEHDAWGHGRGDLHEVEVYSNDSGHQTVFCSTITDWPDAVRMAALEEALLAAEDWILERIDPAAGDDVSIVASLAALTEGRRLGVHAKQRRDQPLVNPPRRQ